MRSLGVITARGSSKRLPRKVVLPINGHPMIAYMCKAALASRLDRVIVSTEDDEIMAICRASGVDAPFRRPEDLCADYAADEDIVDHAVRFCEKQDGKPYDVVVKLQPTTPFVLPSHIDACLDQVAVAGTNCCFTARKVAEPPHWMFSQTESGEAKLLIAEAIKGQFEHAQLLPAFYFPTGAAYAVRVSALREQRRIYCEPYRMAPMEPERSVDVDDDLDLIYADAVARKYGFVPHGA